VLELDLTACVAFAVIGLLRLWPMEVRPMKSILVVCVFSIVFGSIALAQPAGAPVAMDPQPIYRITVVSRTLQAVNYEHRGGPTKIDFQGTVLLPKAKGEATVESKRGRVSIDAKFDHVEPPTKYGTEYLTYVLWAISPEGRPKNLGEVLVDGNNKARLDVTVDLQAFGLIVTAEPYHAVTVPSDVVVLENIVRPDTIGRREMISARYDLLPRGQYTMMIEPNRLRTAAAAQAEALPYDRYEALLELYQAENAVQIARSIGADRYAPESMRKADALLTNARDMHLRKQDTHMIVSSAREAAQIAEDARVISLKRRDEERQRQSQPTQDESRIRMERRDAELARAQAAAEHADAERAEADRAREQAERAEAMAAERARAAAPQHPPLEATPVQPGKYELTGAQRRARAEIMERLITTLDTRDTPRGLVVTVPDTLFEPGHSALLTPTASERLLRVAYILTGRPDLMIRVEGYTDDRGPTANNERFSTTRAQVVRETLVRDGLAPASVSAIGYGNTRPIALNSTTNGKEQNRRVEIVIAGPSIGQMPLWDRTYSLQPRR
jgi:outer membrane protein OmpA-like peptidoglycan-associated protein